MTKIDQIKVGPDWKRIEAAYLIGARNAISSIKQEMQDNMEIAERMYNAAEGFEKSYDKMDDRGLNTLIECLEDMD